MGVYPVASTSGASLASSGGKLLDPVMKTTWERPLVGSIQLGRVAPPSATMGELDVEASATMGAVRPGPASAADPHNPIRLQLSKGRQAAKLHWFMKSCGADGEP